MSSVGVVLALVEEKESYLKFLEVVCCLVGLVLN
jgi:hypothetical protein